MPTRRQLLIVTAALTLAAAGCAEITPADVNRAQRRYEQGLYGGLRSPDSDQWNSTDWSLWMDSQGGGR